MNLSEIEALIYPRIGQPATPDAATVSRIRAYINETHRTILSKKHFASFKQGVLPVATVANSMYVALPFSSVRVNGIRDTSNDRDLERWTLPKMRAIDPGNRLSGGFPEAFAEVSVSSAVKRPPADASQLWFKSSAVGDTTQFLTVEGMNSDGYPYRVSTALNGTTAVQVGTAADWYWVNKLYLSAAAAGNVTLYEDSGTGTVLSVIPAGRTFARYTLLRLWPTPGSVITLDVDCEIRVEDMSAATDEPLIPDGYQHILAVGARIKEYEKREKISLKREAEAEYKDIMTDLYTYVHQNGGTTDPAGRGKRWSQLGPWYPVGS